MKKPTLQGLHYSVRFCEPECPGAVPDAAEWFERGGLVRIGPGLGGVITVSVAHPTNLLGRV